MPRVKIDYVVSFSSEDPDNQASNLLSWDVSKKKWLCRKGEASCSVVLQLAKAVEISSVQVGAHLAALVEVLVGRSETPNEPFQVLVPSCVFLAPREARDGRLADRVRSFDRRALAAPAAAQRWDRVRLVCSQPYNKHCQYGISFIHIFEPEGPASAACPSPPPAAAGPPRPLALDTFSSDEEEFRPGELFAKHRQSSGSASADTGAQIRQATSQALKNNADTGTKLQKIVLPKNKPTAAPGRAAGGGRRERDRDNLMYTKEDEKPHEKIDHIVQRHKDEKTIDEAKTPKSKDKANETGDKDYKTTSSRRGESDDSRNSAKKDEPLTGTHSESKRDSHKLDGRRDTDGNRQCYNKNETTSSNDPSTSGETESKRDKRDRDGNRRNNNITEPNNSKNESRNRLQSDRDESETVVGGGARAGPAGARPLRGVVFALSGYEAQRRRALRDLAVALGARYAPAWGPACTHLICAFPNTPKLREVRRAAGGARVPVCTGEWVEQCGRRRRALPWRWFATERRHRLSPPPSAPASGDSHSGKLREVRRAAGGARVPVCTGEWVEQCGRRRRALPWRWFATERRHRLSPPPSAPASGDSHSGKLREVRRAAGGARVPVCTGEWVEQCGRRRRALPWRWFATERRHRLSPPPSAPASGDSHSGKLREVRRAAGGARVPVCTGEWVEQCGRRRRALPWRWFATERRHRLSPPPSAPASGDSHSGKLREVRRAAGGARVPVCTGEWVEQCGRRRRALPWRWFATERRHRLSPPPSAPASGDSHSESDTDDEIEKVLRRQERARGAAPPPGAPSPGPPAGSGSDDSDVAFVKDERMQGNITVSESDSEQTVVDTDTEAEAPPPRVEGGLPAVLAGRTFVLDEELARPFDVRLLARYVRAYGGHVCTPSQVEEETPEHCYVLCGSRAAARCPRAARAAPAAPRVRADWLWACHRARRLCALRPYV